MTDDQGRADIMDRQGLLDAIRAAGSIEQVDLSSANLAQADLSGLCLDGIRLGDYEKGVGADLTEASLVGTSLRGAHLAYVMLPEAKAALSDLSGADLRGARLSRADFRSADMTSADLYRSDLTGTNLSRCKLGGVNWYLAKLDGTIFQRSCLGRYLLWEEDAQYDAYRERIRAEGIAIATPLPLRLFRASEIYDALCVNWQQIGRLGDASWAYTRARRIKKRLHLPRFARRVYGASRLGDVYVRSADGTERRHGLPATHPVVIAFYARELGQWVGDWFVEVLCNYGESAWRVAASIVAMVLVVGPGLVWLTGGLEWVGANQDIYANLPGAWHRLVYAYFQYVLYMVDTITTASFAELKPANDFVRLLSGLMALLGILLAGLLGFVIGNRIRNK